MKKFNFLRTYTGTQGCAITQKKLDHPVGPHFNQAGHWHEVTYLILMVIERVLPKNDTALRKRREHFWINNYRATSIGSR